MSKGPYSQFITTRHYQLAIRELFAKPKAVLPQLFYQIAYGADTDTIQAYSDAILGTKPDDTITPPDIFNYQSLLATIKSSCWDKFKWMFDNYKYISLIYSDEDNKSIFTNPVNLEYFIGDVIGLTNKSKNNYPSNTEILFDKEKTGVNKILDWLLFSQNTRDNKSYQDWAINLGFYNTRAKIDYKTVYLSAVSAENWNLAQQILEKLIPPGDIQTGRDILHPSLKAGMVATNREFIDFIISVDAANGEWLPQGRNYNFSELENIIRGWYFRSNSNKINDANKTERVEILTWYLCRYFNKYAHTEITNSELGLVIDFTINIIGYLTPELWQVIVQYFKMNSYLKKYNTYAKKRLIAAISMSNLAMSELLLEEYLIISEQTDCEDWIIHIPSDTLISVCGNKNNVDNLAMLLWLWARANNLITDWSVVYSSARTWIFKYYANEHPELITELVRWIWYNICEPRQATLEFAENIITDNFSYILRHPEIIKLIATKHNQLVPKIWEMAINKYNPDICEFLATQIPDIIRELPISYGTYFRAVFNFPDFSSWMIETFPFRDTATRISANLILELITHQYGYYKIQPKYLAKLLNLFPIDGNISQQSNYIFHYVNQNYKSDLEWCKVLYKICLMEPDKYSVILDAEQPNNLALAQFEICAEYMPRAVSQIEQCPICQFAESDIITSCGHQFCRPCINKWLADKKNCPYCRTPCPKLFRAQIDTSSRLGCV
jgi:hypothetical protein